MQVTLVDMHGSPWPHHNGRPFTKPTGRLRPQALSTNELSHTAANPPFSA